MIQKSCLRFATYRVLLEDGSTMGWRDFRVGTSVSLYGTVYHICGCDDFTRKLLEGRGVKVEDNAEPPLDPYHHHLNQRKVMEHEAKSLVAQREKPKSSIEYLENSRKVRASPLLAT
jgi:hypothetical protein